MYDLVAAGLVCEYFRNYTLRSFVFIDFPAVEALRSQRAMQFKYPRRRVRDVLRRHMFYECLGFVPVRNKLEPLNQRTGVYCVQTVLPFVISWKRADWDLPRSCGKRIAINEQ